MSRIIEFRKSAQKSEKQSVQGKTCAFTGHRPQSLPFGFDESDKRCTSLKSVMRDQIVALIENVWRMIFITSAFCSAPATYPAESRAKANIAVPRAMPILLASDTKAYWKPSLRMPVFHSPYSTQSGITA